MPGIAVTGGGCLHAIVAVVDGEMEGDGAVATDRIDCCELGVVIGGGVIDSVPCVTVTGCNIFKK